MVSNARKKKAAAKAKRGVGLTSDTSSVASSERQAPSVTPAAQIVGNAFVEQYYHMLLESPELVHRFYNDVSKLSRPEQNGTMGFTTTIDDINKKILSLGYDELHAEITSMDAQESYGGGVFVLAIGFMSGKDKIKQKFTQCFFLAPQENGYFVLNDVFRYVDENGNQGSANDKESPISPDRVKAMKESAVPSSTVTAVSVRSSFKSQEQQGTAAPPLPSMSETNTSSKYTDEIGHNQETEAEGYSIYVKGLSSNAMPSVLENEFKKFGPIKSGGIQVRTIKGFTYGFVEFEVASAVQSALEASPILINGRHVVVEEKRSTHREVLSSSKANSSTSPGCTKSDLSQKVLESLFNNPKCSEHGKGTMNWRNLVKKMQSLGPEFDGCPHFAESQQHTYAKGDEYHVFREDAKQHWDSMKSCYQKAATAYTKGDRANAAYLSDQGKEQSKLAQKADTKASHDIFLDRNKDKENVITFDLHGQYVKPAMRMLKLHLLCGSYLPSVQRLRVSTGWGSRGDGTSKVKQSVIKLLDKEDIEWREENQGTLLIELNGWREFSFLESDSDSDSN